MRIDEWLGQEHLADGRLGRLSIAGAGQIFCKRFPDKASERYAAASRGFRRSPVEIRGQKELCSMHV